MRYKWLVFPGVFIAIAASFLYNLPPRHFRWQNVPVKSILRMNDETARGIIRWLRATPIPKGGGVVALPPQYRELSCDGLVGVARHSGKFEISLLTQKNLDCPIQSLGFLYFEPGYPVVIRNGIIQDKWDVGVISGAYIDYKMSDNLYYMNYSLGFCG